MAHLLSSLQGGWQSLPYEIRYGAWLVLGVLVIGAMLVGTYFATRRLLGQHRFRGTWYSRAQFAELMAMLMDDHTSGRRVMRHDELTLIRRKMLSPGFKPLFNGKYGGYL